MKATPEQQLAFLSRDVLPMLEAIHEGYMYIPGGSDLDDEQSSIWVKLTRGHYRRAVRIMYQIQNMKEDQND